MNIVVIGAGGVGGYFGGKLTQTNHSVTFLVRGETLKIIKERGLQVNSFSGNFHVRPRVTDDYKVIENADLVILAVKSWQIEGIAEKIKHHLKETTTVLPLQNGADNADRLSVILNPSTVIAGLCKIVSKIESPGIIEHFGYEPEIIFGEITNVRSERMLEIKNAFDMAGIKNRISENIQRDVWLKFLFIASISALGALTRSVLGVMREDDYLRAIMVRTAEEIVSIGQAMGIELGSSDIAACFEVIDKLAAETTMSLQRDMMESRPSELENFNGYIVHQGDRLDIDTPVNDFIYYSLRPMEEEVRREKGEGRREKGEGRREK